MDEALIRKELPQDFKAEQSVIGSMLMDKDAVITVSEILTGEDFYQKTFGIIFDNIVEMTNENIPVDLVTLQNHLKTKDVPDEVSSMSYIREILSAVPTSANAKAYAEIVREKAVLRRLIKASDEISAACYQAKAPLLDILDMTEKNIFQLLNTGNDSNYTPVKEIVLNTLRRIEQLSRQTGSITGIATGFTDLDNALSGLQNSDLILLAARPSMGKTALALNIAQHVAFHSNIPTAIFSLEMSKEQLMNRLFAMEARLDAQALRTGNLTHDQWRALTAGAQDIANSNLIIDDTGAITIPLMRSKCRRFKLEHNLGLIIIDYLQLMQGDGHTDSRQQQISDISRSLKALARELDVPIIALSQLSRAVEQRPDHRPMLSDLREAGAIEQDADVVLFIYRDDYYHPDTEDKGIAEVIIAKQRNGPVGTKRLLWLPNYTKFANLEPERGR